MFMFYLRKYQIFTATLKAQDDVCLPNNINGGAIMDVSITPGTGSMGFDPGPTVSPTAVVPEPTTFVLLLTGLVLGIIITIFQRRRHHDDICL